MVFLFAVGLVLVFVLQILYVEWFLSKVPFVRCWSCPTDAWHVADKPRRRSGLARCRAHADMHLTCPLRVALSWPLEFVAAPDPSERPSFAAPSSPSSVAVRWVDRGTRGVHSGWRVVVSSIALPTRSGLVAIANCYQRSVLSHSWLRFERFSSPLIHGGCLGRFHSIFFSCTLYFLAK